MTLPALSLLLAITPGTPPPCVAVPVRGDAIEARHLAGVYPEFSKLEPDTTIFAAPMPGVLRIVHPDELQRAAKLHGVVFESRGPICISVPLQPLTPERIQEAIRREIGKPRIELEILDYSKVQAPDGDVVFPRAGLAPPPNQDIQAPLVWRGYVQYTKSRRLAIWARVRVSVLSKRLVVASVVKSGEPLRASQLTEEDVRTFPFDANVMEKTSDVEGMLARKTLVPGTVVTRQWLVPPILIQKGEAVTVETRVGGARLILKAVAETAGRLDGTILVRNPSSGRFFQGKIVGPGKVEVGTSGYSYLMHNESRWVKK